MTDTEKFMMGFVLCVYPALYIFLFAVGAFDTASWINGLYPVLSIGNYSIFLLSHDAHYSLHIVNGVLAAIFFVSFALGIGQLV